MLAAGRAAFAALTLAALLVQYLHSSASPSFNAVNFWAYFTNLSNLLAAGVFLWRALRPSAPDSMTPASAWHDFWRGTAVLAMTLTGGLFTLLLSRLDVLVLPGVNVVVHYVMPAAVLADWLIDPPPARLTLRASLSWVVFPVVYGVFTLVRGHFVRWYPYPFLSPAVVGYGGVAIYGVCILAGLILLTWGLVALGNLRQER